MTLSIFDLPQDQSRERVLLYSGPAVGKSYAVLSLAEYLNEISPDTTIWVVDPDRGIQKAWKNEKTDVKIKHIPVNSWEKLEETVDYIGKNHKPGDWVVIEMIGRFWEMAQSYVISEVYGSKAGEYLLLARQKAVQDSKKNQPATMPSVDWNVVKKLHNDDFIDRILSEWDVNVLITTSADPLIREFDDPKIMSQFESVGYKPDGEKRNSHRVDTVMFMTLNAKGRQITTLKDRGRALIADLDVGNNVWVSYDAKLREKGFQFLPV